MKRYTPIKLKSPTAKNLPHHKQAKVPHMHVAASHDFTVMPWSKRGKVPHGKF